jgi:hypothetical protein
MVQSGIAYAAGQLLAVVAPRTVLVVDAPTDWSLAGPLWELALDDAPVDEILDVLIRRGIRTAPSFAIVRVEADAVRALVRGSVPVCFERVGEPVRLDATGATTWLEGLISGARRVLVGAVETNTQLPYLVSTGVVLVSGLALPCGPTEPDGRRNSSPELAESTASPELSDSSADKDSIFTPPVPVASSSTGSSGTARFAPVAGREPRVVDLTRSESRPGTPPTRTPFSAAPEPRESWAMASNRGSDRSAESSQSPMNGHVPAVLEPQPTATESESAPERDFNPLFGDSTSFESRSSALEAAPASFDQPSSYRAPAAFQAPTPSSFQAPTPSSFQAPTPFAPSTPADRFGDFGDDPGELHDMDDDSMLESSPMFEESRAPESGAPESRPTEIPEAASARVFSFPETDHDADVASRDDESGQAADTDRHADDRSAPEQSAPDWDSINWEPEGDRESDQDSEQQVDARTKESLDDLLIEPADDEAPPRPAPTDLPSFEPPAVALPLPSALNGSGVPAQPRGFGGAPAAWPPPPASARSEAEAPAEPRDVFSAPSFRAGSDSDDRADDQDDYSAESDQPPLPDLPLRVRGRSLRPEHSAPVEGRLLGGNSTEPPPSPAQPSARALPPIQPPPVVQPPSRALPPLRSLNDNRYRNGSDDQQSQSGPINGQDDDQNGPDDQPSGTGPGSGGLLLPAFFRGTRSARKAPADQSPAARDRNDVAATPPSGPIPWAQSDSNSAGPAAWVPPVRRGVPDRPGFEDGPPAMPGVLRPANFGQGGFNGATDNDIDRPTERTDPPSDTPSGGVDLEANYDAPREPPRLLGVWCDAGHVTSPENSECRVCGLAVPRQAPILVARPPLGVLIFDNGDRVEIDRPVVLGRDPKPVSSPDPETPVLHAVASATGQVSRTHAEIRADGWDVVLTDLDAMNGTAVTLPGASPMAIEPGVPTVITPGARVDLGGESGFVFEVEG